MSSIISHYQRGFHQRWQHLTNPHVRSLAWLLDSPDLLASDAVHWQGRVVDLHSWVKPKFLTNFLADLERDPTPLLSALDINPFTRLGRYAEALMAFYLNARGVLQAHGLQVRADKNQTIGEFDFLLRSEQGLIHWEFATKFYLLESNGDGHDADYFVGPNLADTLGAKMNKIFERQLRLSEHPAAQALLSEQVVAAQALVKGWLFYKLGELQNPAPYGLTASHCRGFWSTCSELATINEARTQQFAILPRLSWLAPARMSTTETTAGDVLVAQLQKQFLNDTMPVMVALMEIDGDVALEVERGFIVPDDWRTRAGQRIGLNRQQD